MRPSAVARAACHESVARMSCSRVVGFDGVADHLAAHDLGRICRSAGGGVGAIPEHPGEIGPCKDDQHEQLARRAETLEDLHQPSPWADAYIHEEAFCRSRTLRT